MVLKGNILKTEVTNVKQVLMDQLLLRAYSHIWFNSKIANFVESKLSMLQDIIDLNMNKRVVEKKPSELVSKGSKRIIHGHIWLHMTSRVKVYLQLNCKVFVPCIGQAQGGVQIPWNYPRGLSTSTQNNFVPLKNCVSCSYLPQPSCIPHGN